MLIEMLTVPSMSISSFKSLFGTQVKIKVDEYKEQKNKDTVGLKRIVSS